MSFIAAVLILNLDSADAFIAFSNLLNKPCQMAFFRVDHGLVSTPSPCVRTQPGLLIILSFQRERNLFSRHTANSPLYVFLKIPSLTERGGAAPARMCTLRVAAAAQGRAPHLGPSRRAWHRSPPLLLAASPGLCFLRCAPPRDRGRGDDQRLH